MPPRQLWLIDLDNTLHDASWRAIGEINQRMTRYVADHLGLTTEDASALRVRYWHRYGATLLGMMRHHRVDPHDFLHRTHPVAELPQMIRRIRGEHRRLLRLRGDRWLLSNAPRAYAEGVLQWMGLRHLFKRLITVEDMRICGRLRPKPSGLLMRHVLRHARRPAHRVALIDDHDENLAAAHRLGIRTARILVSRSALRSARHAGRPLGVRRPAYVRLQVNSLAILMRNQHRLGMRHH